MGLGPPTCPAGPPTPLSPLPHPETLAPPPLALSPSPDPVLDRDREKPEAARRRPGARPRRPWRRHPSPEAVPGATGPRHRRPNRVTSSVPSPTWTPLALHPTMPSLRMVGSLPRAPVLDARAPSPSLSFSTAALHSADACQAPPSTRRPPPRPRHLAAGSVTTGKLRLPRLRPRPPL